MYKKPMSSNNYTIRWMLEAHKAVNLGYFLNNSWIQWGKKGSADVCGDKATYRIYVLSNTL